MAQKVLNLRIFEDEDGKMNQKITQINQGKILSISQFTLSWPGKKGNRPSFTNSMNPTTAEIYYTKFNILLEKETQIETGIFGEDMKVSLINDGPVTFMLES
jgi:D-tyrosyl-tRNA(Tyr) deacylase